ncbi:Imm1 family immunity protein [Saccharopolyspora elongata]|uniref:Immunity protein Imm1 n=1 Tax=Saccharopolyspora elongata TaxID=2530387 RepID=A0A4R4Y6A7_9PSEU|nr:Imm1 family immunity protein [Saccharopolyspora elongata]TDD39806.1 hypothetical protein E1288_36440 [Saccharopolyspora elongata]
MTAATQTVVTAIVDKRFHYSPPAAMDDLIRAVVDEPHHLNSSQVYVWDRPCRSWRADDGPAFPKSRLVVYTLPEFGWGALNHVDADNDEVVDSYNPDNPPHIPQLWFDPDGQLQYPATAAIPLDHVRNAVAEFCLTGKRPTCVRWQPGRWF